jgi:CRP-like cAMP-binding protein
MLPTSPSFPSTENQILAALDKTDYQVFLSQSERVSLPLGALIYEADDRLNYIYFPETAVFSMLATMEDGRTVEVGPVGKEGLVGLRVACGAETTLDRVVVHMAGNALRMPASALKAELGTGRMALWRKLTSYACMLLAMTGRTSACNKLHTLDQQLARWLLTMSDYVGNELQLTHELMALTLGVRRAGVSIAASSFRDTGAINYQRGAIQVINREALEAIACECYQVIKEAYADLYADLGK